MKVKLKFSREALLHDISTEAYVAADVEEGKFDPHSLHQTFDICQEGNIDRVDRLLSLSFWECREILAPLTPQDEGRRRGGSIRDGLPFRGDRTFTIHLPSSAGSRTAHHISHMMHEYLVARVLGLWLSVTLPSKSGAWEKKGADLREALVSVVADIKRKSGVRVLRRSCSPF